MSAGTVEEMSSPAFAEESDAPVAENYIDDPSSTTDSELQALANEYSGIVFEWGAYKGTSHEIIQRCPWAKEAGAIMLRAVFEAGKASSSNAVEELKEENQEEKTDEQPEEQAAETKQDKSDTSKPKEVPAAKENIAAAEEPTANDGPLEKPVVAEPQIHAQEPAAKAEVSKPAVQRAESSPETLQDSSAATEEASRATAQPETHQGAEVAESQPEGLMKAEHSPNGYQKIAEHIQEKRAEPISKSGSARIEAKPAVKPAENAKVSVQAEKPTTISSAESSAKAPEALPDEEISPVAVEPRELKPEIIAEQSEEIERPVPIAEQVVEPDERLIFEIPEDTAEAEVVERIEPTSVDELELTAEQPDDEVDYPLEFDEDGEEETAHLINELEESAAIGPEGLSLKAETAADEMERNEEPIYELPLPVERVEEVVEELAQFIEELDDEEELSTVHEILDDIASKIEELRAEETSEDSIQEDTAELRSDSLNNESQAEKTDAEEELKELFIELFDYAEIEYTPELIESFIRLALQQDIAELISEVDEEKDTLHDRGTHEIIQQILKAIATVKKAAKQAYEIGRRALNLYSQRLALVPA